MSEDNLPALSGHFDFKNTVTEYNPQTKLYEIFEPLSGKLLAVVGDQNRLADFPQEFVEHEFQGSKFLVQVGVGVDFIPGSRKIPYNEVIVNIVCEKICEGSSLYGVSKIPGMPSYGTLCNWKRTNEEFKTRIAQAYEDRADYLVDRSIEELESLQLGSHDSEDASVIRTKSDGFFKAASFGNREKYGNQTKISGNVGAVQIIIDTGISRNPNNPNYRIDETAKLIKDAEVPASQEAGTE